MMKENIEIERFVTAEQLAELFSELTKGDGKELKAIQMKLDRLSSHAEFLSTMLSIPLHQNVAENIAKMAVVYTRTYARKIIASRDQAKINIMLDQLFKYLSQSNVKFRLRRHVANTLEQIIAKDTKQIILLAFIPNYIDLLKRAVQEQDQNINFEFIGLFGQILMSASSMRIEQIVTFIQETMLNFISLSLRIMKYVKQLENGNIMKESLQLSIIYTQVIKGYMKKCNFVNANIAHLFFDPIFFSFISTAIGFALPNNQIDSPVIYISEEDFLITQLFHEIKANSINIFTKCLRILFYLEKATVNFDLRQSNLIGIIPNFIPCFVQSVKSLLDRIPYYNIKSAGKIKVVEEIFHFLMLCVRTNVFYNIFSQLKQQILQCIYRILALSPQDYRNYYHQPQQFLNSLNHILDMDININIVDREKQNDDDEIQIYSTMKTVAAGFLDTIANYIDGTLSEIFYFAGNVLEDFLNTQYSKNLFLIVLSILRVQTKDRTDLHAKLSSILFKLLNDLDLPKKSTEEPENIQFSLALLTLSRYYGYIARVNDTVVEKTFALTEKIFQCQSIEEVPKLISYDLIVCSLHFEEASIFCLRFLFVFNNLFAKEANVTPKFLQCLSSFFRYSSFIARFNEFQFKNNIFLVMDTVTKLVNLLGNELKKGKEMDLVKTGNAWVVIEEIVSSKILFPSSNMKLPINQNESPSLTDQIEQKLILLFEHLDGTIQTHYEEKLFNVFTTFIKRNKKVTMSELKLLQIVPKLFYAETKNKHFLAEAFQVIQLMIYFGSELLVTNAQYIKNLILMSNDAMNGEISNERRRTEADNCEGVLTLQNLIIGCGGYFDGQMWIILTNSITKRLHFPAIQYDFLRANIITNLSLILMYAHKFFSPEDCDNMLGQVLRECSCFTSNRYSKIFIVTMTQIMSLVHLQYIQKRFVQILDCLITLIQISNLNKGAVFKDAELDPEELHYSKISRYIINKVQEVNQLNHFRNKMQELKNKCPNLLESSFKELLEEKKNYLREILSTVKIGNEARVLIKIKK